METLTEAAVVVAGFLLRFGVPLVITALLAWLLRRLDSRWQAEAEAMEVTHWVGSKEQRLACWEARNCALSERRQCPAYQQPEMPCWHSFRDGNGALKEECLACELFLGMPLAITEDQSSRRIE